MNLDSVRKIADAVLYEGYILYPYRASAQKNRSRWEGATLGGLFRATVWSSRHSCRSICRRHQTVQTQGRGGDLVNQMARGWYPDSNDDTAEI